MKQHPIVFFIFNRPLLTRIVFEKIQQQKPNVLFLIADGPRILVDSDDENCKITQEIVSEIDWECEIHRNYSDVNLGCKLRISSGLDWVFEQVDSAIILEDDCLATPDFFAFCNKLLDRYQDDERIFSIAGSSFHLQYVDKSQASYYYSRYPQIWGWATWRRAWKYYDVTMSLWKSDRDKINLKGLEQDWQILAYWKHLFDKVAYNQIDTWDYQWIFASLSQNALHVIPDKNLVSNIGFGQDATHTKQESHLSNLETDIMQFPLRHPLTMIRNYEADRLTEIKVYECRMKQRIFRKILSYLSKLNA
jgi:hypothetical protein